MRRFVETGFLVAVLLQLLSVGALAQSTRSTPAIQQLYQQSLTAIKQERYLQATQFLTRLIGLPYHVHSQQAQELLGNVREANGQLAHAVAEYQIYLSKYPDGPGASRVRQRLQRILSGSMPVNQQPDVAAVESDRTSAARPSDPRRRSSPVRQRFGRGGAVAGKDGLAPDEPTVTSRGSVRMVYRYNEGATRFTELTPGGIPGISEKDEYVFDNALTAILRYSRVYEDRDKRITLSFAGNLTADFDDSDDSESRLYEAFARWENKRSGMVLTFGRQRMEPRAVAYRLDGLTLSWPVESGVSFGVFAGSSVESTRDDFFSTDTYLFGASATLPEGMVGPGALSGYLFEQRTSSYTDRRVIGLEYDYDHQRGGTFANMEYDLLFGEFNRALVTGTRVLPNTGRVTARLAYYRSPTLSVENALIGQSADSIDELKLNLSNEEIEDLALSRSSKVATLGMVYYGPINDTWKLSAYGTFYYTSGIPATVGVVGADDVAAVDGDGVRSYFGLGVSGSSIFMDNDRLNLGVRYANSDDSNLYIASASWRMQVTDELLLRPRFRIGYRDEWDGGTEKFFITSIFSRYRINRQTDLQFEIGGNWSKHESPTESLKEQQYFITAGISRTF